MPAHVVSLTPWVNRSKSLQVAKQLIKWDVEGHVKCTLTLAGAYISLYILRKKSRC